MYTVVDIRLLKMKKVIKQSTVHASGRLFSLQMYIVRTFNATVMCNTFV